ncbi:MAG: hypothetical protein CV087_17595 [Candidatus Brocadia sp. WS118]|nr:MAG: hypothetical protein CV087_17595 [Candidatus Brocadia sp. WS118]
MAKLTGSPVLGEVDLYTSNTDQGAPELGQLVFGANGKAFRYAKAGASALVVGNLLQSPAIDTQFDDMAIPSATAAGSYEVVVTNGTTVLTGNEFVGGTLEVSVTPGLGEEYTILYNSSAASGAALTLRLDRPLRTAWTTSTKVTLRKSPYNGVIQAPATTLTGEIVGVAIYPIAAGEYGWIQTKGVGAVLSDNSSITATNQAVCGGSGTAGCVTLQVAGLPYVGRAMRAGATGKTIPVLLAID